MDQNQIDQERQFMEAVSFSHLYHQQHMIDEFKIDHAEYVRRMTEQGLDKAGLEAIMAANADRLATDDHTKTILQRALDLLA